MTCVYPIFSSDKKPPTQGITEECRSFVLFLFSQPVIALRGTGAQSPPSAPCVVHCHCFVWCARGPLALFNVPFQNCPLVMFIGSFCILILSSSLWNRDCVSQCKMPAASMCLCGPSHLCLSGSQLFFHSHTVSCAPFHSFSFPFGSHLQVRKLSSHHCVCPSQRCAETNYGSAVILKTVVCFQCGWTSWSC